MQVPISYRLRSATTRLRSYLSLSHWVDLIESRCTYFEDANSEVSFPIGSHPCVYGGVWYKGKHIGSYNEYDGTPGRKQVIKQWLLRKLLHCAAYIGIVGCAFIMSFYLFP